MMVLSFALALGAAIAGKAVSGEEGIAWDRDANFFIIRVVDGETGRPVPLVELKKHRSWMRR